MSSHGCTAPRRTHGVMARLTRLAASALAVSVVFAACTALAQTPVKDATVAQHHCIHDELQERVLNSARERSSDPDVVMASVGLPTVKAVSPAVMADGDVEALADSFTLVTSGSANVTRSDEWGRLRIAVSALDLNTTGYHCSTVGEVINNHLGDNVTCTEADVLTEDKYDILMNYLIPQALEMHQDRLQVRQVQDSWAVADMSGRICGTFKVPEEHLTTGVNDTDFVLYVTSAPARAGVGAWATTCLVFTNNQPAVGVINIPAVNLVSRYDVTTTRIVTHEIAHSLGFASPFFRVTGIRDNVTGIRGKTYAALVINSTTVVNKTREQYGCDSATYMELEDWATAGTVNSHWKMRNAANELMAPAATAGYYTALTMALFEDLGFYKANFSKAESMSWGHNASCDFLTEKCMVDGVTKWPEMFCNVEDDAAVRCTTSRTNLGTCSVSMFFDGDYPTYFQYFAEPDLGGMSPLYDYCPVVEPWSATSGPCSRKSAFAGFWSFNVFSDASRCIDGSFTPKVTDPIVTEYTGLCANVRCNTAAQTYEIHVYGSAAYAACTPGSTVALSSMSDAFEAGGYITCPPYAEVCQGNVQGAMDYAASLGNGAVGRATTVQAIAAALLVAAVVAAVSL